MPHEEDVRDLSLKAYLEAVLEIGIDLDTVTSPGGPDIFLFDYNPATSQGTRISAGIKALGQNLNLSFSVLDSFELAMVNGAVTVDADGDAATNPELSTPGNRSDFASVIIALDQQSGGSDDGKFHLSEIADIANNLDFSIGGGFEIELPVELRGFGVLIADFASSPLMVSGTFNTGGVDPASISHALPDLEGALGAILTPWPSIWPSMPWPVY